MLSSNKRQQCVPHTRSALVPFKLHFAYKAHIKKAFISTSVQSPLKTPTTITAQPLQTPKSLSFTASASRSVALEILSSSSIDLIFCSSAFDSFALSQLKSNCRRVCISRLARVRLIHTVQRCSRSP